eukprot:jgi/Antlo1/99/252
MDEKRNAIAKKTYRVDMCVRWDRDVLGRAVEMLGGQQSHVSAERVETILRAMANLSTGTESEHVHDASGAMEVLWDRDTFKGAADMHGEQLQSKVDAEEVEAVLYAMAYRYTGKVDIVHVSEYMKASAKHSSGSYKITWDTETFDKTYNILIGKKQDKVNADDTVKILHLMDDLKIQEEWKEACYDKLARKTMEDHKRARQKSAIGEIKVSRKEEKSVGRRLLNIFLLCMQNLRRLSVKRKTKEDNREAAIGDIEEIGKELVADPHKTDNIFLYTQHLLRLYAEEHGMSLTVDEKRKTLDLRRSHSKKEQRENRTEDWMLRVEVSEEYRRQREVQRLVEVLMETKDMAVEMDVREYRPEDRGMLERIAFRAKKTELRIKCRRERPRAIAEHMQSLKNNIVELDVSCNRDPSDEDWKTVGEMAGLKTLNISCCGIQAGTIAQHMQSLNLVELNVSYNKNLIYKDWETVGKMTRLERLNISHCNTRMGTIKLYMQNLKNNLVDLDVSGNYNLSNKDWNAVKEMTGLERLNISHCDLEPEAIAQHMQSLNNNLAELDVSENYHLSNKDWNTVGKIAGLKKLKMVSCHVKPGTIAQNIRKLKNNLVELDVSDNKNLSNEDWKTVGEMTRLEKLNIRFCHAKPGTIAQHMRKLKNNLVELDVSYNTDLSNEDWKTVREMTRLEKLNISHCYVKPETIAQHMLNLKNNLMELDFSCNYLRNKDWKTVGEMTRLERLKMQDCNVKPGVIAQHMRKLKNNLIVLDVSKNKKLSDGDWKTVGEMTRLETLDISDCNLQTGTIAKYMQKLNLVELDVSWNKNLSCEDWKTVVEKMTRIKRLDISNCQVDENLLYGYLYERLGHCIEEMDL